MGKKKTSYFNKRYGKGRRAEYWVIAHLKKKGASLVIRSAGSHKDADIVAFFPKKKEVWLVQVKTSKTGINILQITKEYPDFGKLDGTYEVKTGYLYKDVSGWHSTFR